MHVAGMRTQVEAILSELEDGEKFSDILFLIPTSKSPAYHALLKALDMLDVHRIDFTIKGNRNTTPRDHQVRISTFHSSRGVEASIVVLLDLERLAERTRARQQLYIGLTRAVRLAIVLEPDIAVSQLATLLERAAACINAASTNQDFKKNIPQRPVKRPTSTSVKSAIPIDQATQSGTLQAEAQNDDTDGEVIHIPDDIGESLTLNVESASSVDTVSTTEQADTHSSQITAEAQSGATRDQQTAKRHESVPSGFGTSIFAVVASKTVDIGKRIDALYNWDTYTDLSEE
jgi:ATP-dependent exoDNAse (exonuclease V) beta subunit